MRIRGPVLALLLTACGLKTLLPEGPALDTDARNAFVDLRSGARYTGPPQVDFPVLPVIVWGAAYDLDLVLVSQHPTWNMHEYARLQTPDGPLWIAKDAREATMSQSVVADLDDVHAWMPELPIERKSSPVEVIDRSADGWLDLELRYHNIDGEPVEVTYRGREPRTRQRKRNGNTMGHSQDDVLAVLDLPLRNFARNATMRIDGEDIRLERILGLLPFRMALVQSQGGLARGTLRQELGDGGVETVHITPGGPDVRLAWTSREADGQRELRQEAPLRTLVYRFGVGDDGAHELRSARVEQYGRASPVTEVLFTPALPDLARPFEGRVVARFVIDINGQRGHAVGRVEAWWEADGPRLDVIPEAPPWTTDRPLRARWSFSDGRAHTSIEIRR